MKYARLDAGVVILVLMAILFIGGILAVFFTVGEDPTEAAQAQDRIIDVLFVVERENKPLLAFVLMFYPETRRGVLIDIPGETGQIIRSLGRVDRIDALYDRKKPTAYLQEIGGLLGIEIPYAFFIELSDLSRLVDLLEGVEAFIPDAVRELDENRRILLPSGTVTLDGAKAGVYLTYELEEEDPAIVHGRRQRFILSLLSKLGELFPFLSSDQVRETFLGLLDSNKDRRTTLDILGSMADLDFDRMAVQRITGNLRDVSGQQLLFPYYDGTLIKDIVKQSLSSLVRDSDGWVAERVYSVEVLNGTSNQGLATRTADLLAGFGYDTGKVGNADRNDYETTMILNRIGDEKAARLLADVIKCRMISVVPRAESEDANAGFDEGVDFTLIIGKDFNGRYVVP